MIKIKCDLCGNGKYGGLSDIYQSTVHGARPTRNLRPPGGDHPAAQRACPSLRTRSRARRGPQMHYPGRLGERGGAGRGRTGPGAANPERALSAYSFGWRRNRTHAMDIDGARRRSHEPTAVLPELGLGWQESTHCWTGTTSRAASLDCSEWSEEKGAGRARLDRVEGGDSRRTGPSRTKIQDVRLEVGHGLCQQTTLTELFRNDS